MAIEKEYEDVLKNLERQIINCYREQPDLIDWEVDLAIDWLIKIYNAEAQGKTSSYRSPRGTSGKVAAAVQTLCELHIGRAASKVEDKKTISVTSDVRRLQPAELVQCLKCIKSSIKFWTKMKGRQGYLDFVAQFL